MQIKTITPRLTQAKGVPGLLEGALDFKLESASSTVKWVGPKITPAVWLPVLAFFLDTYNRTKSESQVRLYCNPRLGTWAAWAFPQEAQTGMSAREIANPAASEQRERFKESDGWQYSGTVHHHCAASAFQSFTDRNNEQNQDGLHITIGNMDKPQHDLHARFYLSGCEFEPDLSVFWDIGDTARSLVPANVHDAVARFQMCHAAPLETEFPALWRENLIETRVAGFFGNAGAGNGATGSHVYTPPTGSVGNGIDFSRRKELALTCVKNACKQEGISEQQMDAVFILLDDEDIAKFIRQAAIQHDLTIFNIVDEWRWEQDMRKQFPDENAWEAMGSL